jgi:hypothetical protein
MLALLLLIGPSPPDTAVSRFEFRNEAVHAGRSVLAFRPLTLGPTPVRPVTSARPFGAGARHGLALVGPSPDTALTVVWAPDAGPWLWLDADGDGRLTEAECHRMTEKELSLTADIALSTQKGAPRVRRTLVFRRSPLGDGLSVAVCGYAAGRLTLGNQVYRALLTDGNADGCFHAAGSDRLWLDLNGDDHFDGLTEQFLLGSPLTVAGAIYLVKADPAAAEVRVTRRTTARGTLRITLTGKLDRSVRDVEASLVSDIGELVLVRSLHEPVALPAGKYRVDAVKFRMTDELGRDWAYRFVGGGPFPLTVRAGKEVAGVLLNGLRFKVEVSPARVAAGQTVAVSPSLEDGAGLYLAECTVADATNAARGATADITLRAPDGAVADQTTSGFA